jgi:RNA polymerase sigma factor (TIGR02999 family)
MLQTLPADGARAAEELLPLVYEELRRLASQKLARESHAFTLQPTALVHEAWLRLTQGQPGRFENRAHFFAAASEAMRRVLVDVARRKQSAKRGELPARVELAADDLVLAAPPEEILMVDEAVEVLVREDPPAGELVKLRYFVGLSMEESALVLGVPVRSAERLWTFAKAWLRRRITSELKPSPGAPAFLPPGEGNAE